MPEGPELARSRDALQRIVSGNCINSFKIVGGRYRDKEPVGLAGFRAALDEASLLIDSVNVKGKFMWWEFFTENNVRWDMWCTYGMSGRWTTAPADKHTGATMTILTGGGIAKELNFHDPRHFGTLKFSNDNQALIKKLGSLGPDMLNGPPEREAFKDRMLLRPRRTLAEALMDQSTISGVGNYIKAEALYLAELSPHRTCDSLSTAECERLRQQIINVMKASYVTGGATIRTYRNADGTVGSAQGRFVVYGNRTDPMGNPVVKEGTKDGRTTHWVPSIQR
jgi:formamidopyrimidine-DNA glycosylase